VDIGQRLRSIRGRPRPAQRETEATKGGLTNGTISLIERTRQALSVAYFEKLAGRRFPISMAGILFDFEDTQTPSVF